jgi:hypothetical protein
VLFKPIRSHARADEVALTANRARAERGHYDVVQIVHCAPQILVFEIRAIVSAGEDRLNISHGIFHGEFAISNDRLV